MAIAVGLPRWTGAMMGADGIDPVGLLDDIFKVAYVITIRIIEYVARTPAGKLTSSDFPQWFHSTTPPVWLFDTNT